MICHERDLQDQDVEELAEELWTLGEEGRQGLADLRATSQVTGIAEALAQMERRGLARVEGERVLLTESGRQLAERQVRRHRLAEMLFTTVLEIADDAAANRTACVMEHVLDGAMTDSVCAFLGHPGRCPHGKPIPAGSCCRAFSQLAEPLVLSLVRLAPGESGRVVHIVPREAGRLMRLAGLGLVPGTVVQLQQTRPAVVLRVGESVLALEAAVAEDIFVRKVQGGGSR